MADPGYRGRFAPSPTGRLHFGSLVAAVASYAQARARSGVWLVRMEDLDRPREVPGIAALQLADLAAFGMVSDEPVIYQSQRDTVYGSALQRLEAAGLTFRCSCSRSSLSGRRVYPGYCRQGPLNSDRATAVRLRVDDQAVSFVDAVQGRQMQGLADEVGDFVIKRVDGLFAYQLAVVVDDAAQRVTEVVRGADLLDSTSRQIYLQRLLSLPTPGYLHVPLAVNHQGTKLSKQSMAQPVDTADPLTGLIAAWRFLGQLEPPASCRSVDTFWAFAPNHWSVAAIPAARSIAV